MIVAGKTIRDRIVAELTREVSSMSPRPSLAIFLPEHPDFATTSFVAIKKKIAAQIGIPIIEHTLGSEMTTEEVINEMECVAKDTTGIIVQFPTSPHLDAERIRNAIPLSHDVDAVSEAAVTRFEKGESSILPPVVGAIAEICREYQVVVQGKNVVVVGVGRLVGKPSAVWCKANGAHVTVSNRNPLNTEAIQSADILILGAGIPSLITPEMVKEGVIIFDAGTSEAEGKLSGDADPSVASKCSLFTPVPGGIGPITVAFIFKNLITLKKASV